MPADPIDRLRLAASIDDPNATIRLAGDVDLGTIGRVTGIAHGLLAAGASTLVFDLAEVRFMDSTGLSLLAELAQRTAERDGKVIVRNPNDLVVRLLELSGLIDLVSIA